MFSHPMKLVFFAFALCALLAVATPVLEARGGVLPCSNGKKTMCCGGLDTYSPSALGLILGLLGLAVGVVEEVLSTTGLVGLKCTPISLLGGIGVSDVCKHEGVCCSDLDLHGVLTVGCVPINIL